jgi:hypothetical protein
MEWIIVKPQGSMNSYDRAKAITRELYNISRPVYLQRDNEALATCFEMIRTITCALAIYCQTP